MHYARTCTHILAHSFSNPTVFKKTCAVGKLPEDLTLGAIIGTVANVIIIVLIVAMVYFLHCRFGTQLQFDKC